MERLTWASSFIDEILVIAGKSDGRVFGGYVRDVIIPRIKNPSCRVGFNDVDIWFKRSLDATTFVEAMESFVKSSNITFRMNPGFTIQPGTVHYAFQRTQYHLRSAGPALWIAGPALWIDVVVSDICPVDDFDVNCLTYLYANGVRQPESFYSDFYTDPNSLQLVNAIIQKRAVMLPTYFKKMLDYPDFRNCIMNRIEQKYLKRGWIISYHDNDYICKLPERIQAWIRNNLQEATK